MAVKTYEQWMGDVPSLSPSHFSIGRMMGMKKDRRSAEGYDGKTSQVSSDDRRLADGIIFSREGPQLFSSEECLARVRAQVPKRETMNFADLKSRLQQGKRIRFQDMNNKTYQPKIELLYRPSPEPYHIGDFATQPEPGKYILSMFLNWSDGRGEQCGWWEDCAQWAAPDFDALVGFIWPSCATR